LPNHACKNAIRTDFGGYADHSALVRAGTLAEAAQRLGIDASTIFRSVQRIERGLGQRLFERSRSGYRATPLGAQLARHAERIESELAAARSTVQASSDRVSGSVHVTTTDTVLYGLVLPALRDFAALHPALSFELTAANSLASLTKRDADIAVRATRRAPDHLVGKHVGPLRIAVFASRSSGIHASDVDALARCDWAAPDASLGDHPSVLWRKRHCPIVEPRYKTNSVASLGARASGVAAFAACGCRLYASVATTQWRFRSRRRRALTCLSLPARDSYLHLYA
jgi:DNA-binding transcriptional LysR family regulator